MILIKTGLSLIVLTALTSISAYATADTMIENANGYTLNRQQKLIRFDALVFDDSGKITAVGHSKKLLRQFPLAQRINLHGKTLLPGLIDAHGHVLALGHHQAQLSLRETRTLAEAQGRISDYAQRFPSQLWILGGEWNQVNWDSGRFPTASDIDTVVSDRPVWLSRVDGHAAWANSRAMQLAGIGRDTPDSVGGKIERDAQGNPTGILIDNAMDLIQAVIPPASDAGNRMALDAALLTLAQSGLTSVHDAGVSAEADRLFREYAANSKLSVRIYGMISGTDDFFERISREGPLLSDGQDRYALRAVKLFADGALGSRGAALAAPYSDAPDTSGLLFQTKSAMAAMIKKAADKGYQVNVHAIGDAANRQILDGFAALPAAARKLARHRIEHAQVLAVEDIPRFKSLNIIPSMQPVHATSDMKMAEQRVGHERIKGAYAWRRYLKQGSRIACGSDFPVESANPFWGIHAAVTRRSRDGEPLHGWYADQAMTLTEAFRCFTLDAAYAAHQENIIGSLEKGKWADFIVVDRDMFTIPAQQIHQIQVVQTWLAGKVVYQNEAPSVK
ncbi:amidohydrolase [Undibacterium sp. WLX3042]|uniref:amidohydrolase n=1 Tax=Undibacterium sp. WLX3042 TaxID=3412686 RepID=UPI003C2E5CCB